MVYIDILEDFRLAKSLKIVKNVFFGSRIYGSAGYSNFILRSESPSSGGAFKPITVRNGVVENSRRPFL